jgi:hypothetical protein
LRRLGSTFDPRAGQEKSRDHFGRFFRSLSPIRARNATRAQLADFLLGKLRLPRESERVRNFVRFERVAGAVKTGHLRPFAAFCRERDGGAFSSRTARRLILDV